MGRLAYTDHAVPAVGLVEFTVDDDQILVRPVSGGTVEVAHGGMVAFEVDQIDPRTRTGWSVVVLGQAEVTDGPDQSVRVRAERMTGRQLLPATDDWGGVRLTVHNSGLVPPI